MTTDLTYYGKKLCLVPTQKEERGRIYGDHAERAEGCGNGGKDEKEHSPGGRCSRGGCLQACCRAGTAGELRGPLKLAGACDKFSGD